MISSRKISLIRLGENSTSDEYFFQGGLPRGIEGCTHLTELLGPMATTAYQALWDQLIDVEQQNSGKAAVRYALNGCHALNADGELVRLYFSDSVDVQR